MALQQKLPRSPPLSPSGQLKRCNPQRPLSTRHSHQPRITELNLRDGVSASIPLNAQAMKANVVRPANRSAEVTRGGLKTKTASRPPR
jgi:hypothetical protein